MWGGTGWWQWGQRPLDSGVERAASMVMVRVPVEDVSWQVVILGYRGAGDEFGVGFGGGWRGGGLKSACRLKPAPRVSGRVFGGRNVRNCRAELKFRTG